jgi:hypothetical protein
MREIEETGGVEIEDILREFEQKLETI